MLFKNLFKRNTPKFSEEYIRRFKNFLSEVFVDTFYWNPHSRYIAVRYNKLHDDIGDLAGQWLVKINICRFGEKHNSEFDLDLDQWDTCPEKGDSITPWVIRPSELHYCDIERKWSEFFKKVACSSYTTVYMDEYVKDQIDPYNFDCFKCLQDKMAEVLLK